MHPAFFKHGIFPFKQNCLFFIFFDTLKQICYAAV